MSSDTSLLNTGDLNSSALKGNQSSLADHKGGLQKLAANSERSLEYYRAIGGSGNQVTFIVTQTKFSDFPHHIRR